MYASNRDGKKYEPSPKPHDFQLVLVHKYPVGPTPPEDREGTPPKLEQFRKQLEEIRVDLKVKLKLQ